jgi:hypothetical protein
MLKLKTPLIIILILLGVTAGFILSKGLATKVVSPPLVFRLNEIKKVRQLKLVTYHFEEIIPIEKNGKIKLLLIVPATVSGYIDLDALQYRIFNDTLISVSLPSASVDSANFQIENAVNYDLEKRFSINLGTGLYQEVFEELKEKLKISKINVTQKAFELGLESSTNNAAKEYISALLSDLEYVVEFKDKNLLNYSD